MDLGQSDRLHLLKCVQIMTDTGKWNGIYTYPNCGWDLVESGYVLNKEPNGSGVEITDEGRKFLQENAYLLKTDSFPFMKTELAENCHT